MTVRGAVKSPFPVFGQKGVRKKGLRGKKKSHFQSLHAFPLKCEHFKESSNTPGSKFPSLSFLYNVFPGKRETERAGEEVGQRERREKLKMKSFERRIARGETHGGGRKTVLSGTHGKTEKRIREINYRRRPPTEGEKSVGAFEPRKTGQRNLSC